MWMLSAWEVEEGPERWISSVRGVDDLDPRPIPFMDPSSDVAVDVVDEAEGDSGPGGVPDPPPVSISGLFSGLIPREELKEEFVDSEGDGERIRMLEMVDEIVFRAACLARSVDTKLFTSSFRFPPPWPLAAAGTLLAAPESAEPES